jgi:hypothetical protein
MDNVAASSMACPAPWPWSVTRSVVSFMPMETLTWRKWMCSVSHERHVPCTPCRECFHIEQLPDFKLGWVSLCEESFQGRVEVFVDFQKLLDCSLFIPFCEA